MIDFGKIRGWVFDIDDTLILERSYVLSGFTEVAQWLLSVHKIRGFYAAAIARLKEGLRGNIFDAAMSDLGIDPHEGLIKEMVEIYRSHEPKIALEPDAVRLIERLRRLPIGVVSDGHFSSQSRKSVALNLAGFASPIILTDAWGREFWKPHVRGFRAIEAAWGMMGDELVYIADNPGKDFDAPTALGWQTIRLTRPQGEHVNLMVAGIEPRLTVRSLDEILPYI
jgi:putative hydrolase of the HAD superfamily